MSETNMDNMKKNTLWVLLCLSSICYAQVGIGTNDPQETLHVNGDVIVDGFGTTDSNVLVGADDQGTLTTLDLGNNLIIKDNKLTLVRSPYYGIGEMDISGITVLGQHTHDLDLQLGVGEINEGKTVINVYGTPSNIKLTGIQDGTDGLHLFFYHTDSNNIFFEDQTSVNSLLSQPENRINVLASSETISGQGSVELIYDGDSQKWLFLSIHD